MVNPQTLACGTRPSCGKPHASTMARGFSLVELLVVITIILVLAGLVIVIGGRVLSEMVDRSVMQRKAEQVVAGLAQYQTSDGQDRGLAVINGATGTSLRFGTLRNILDRLTGTYGLDLNLDTASVAKDDTDRLPLPPGIGTRYRSYAMVKLMNPTNNMWVIPGRLDKFAVTDIALDEVITFRNRMIRFRWDPYDRYPLGLGGVPEHALAFGTKMSIADHYSDVFEFRTSRWGDAVLNTYPRYDARISPIGESLDRTLEVMPDRIWYAGEYLARWPRLIQQFSTVGGATRYVSKGLDASGAVRDTVWPTWNWQAGDPTPVIWPWPWGKKVLRRRDSIAALDQIEGLVPQGDVLDPANPAPWADPDTGKPVKRLVDATRLASDLNPDYLIKARSADCLSPLGTVRILAMAGILEPGAAGEDAYRGKLGKRDRDRNRAWNDRWGRPLVAGFAAFIAARYDFDDTKNSAGAYNEGFGYTTPFGNGSGPMASSGLLGGRDVLLTTLAKMYGSAWQGYLCVGATGPADRGTGFDASWDAAEDARQLVLRWRTITTACAAWEWNQTAFSAPPAAWSRPDPDGGTWKVDAWSRNGMRKGVRGDGTACYLSAPIDLK